MTTYRLDLDEDRIALATRLTSHAIMLRDYGSADTCAELATQITIQLAALATTYGRDCRAIGSAAGLDPHSAWIATEAIATRALDDARACLDQLRSASQTLHPRANSGRLTIAEESTWRADQGSAYTVQTAPWPGCTCEACQAANDDDA